MDSPYAEYDGDFPALINVVKIMMINIPTAACQFPSIMKKFSRLADFVADLTILVI